MRVFLDTNVILDALVDRVDSSFRELAEYILQLGEDGSIELFMSIISIPTMAYVMKSIPPERKKAIIEEICSIVKVLPSLPEHVSRVLSGKMSDIEDGLQAQSAKHGNCALIVTRNVRDYKQSGLPVLSPQEFLHHVFGMPL